MPQPAVATDQARAALAAAGITGLRITSQRTGTAFVTTWVRVGPGMADRVLAILRELPGGAGSGGGGAEVWARRHEFP
jgi:hypothetical protein